VRACGEKKIDSKVAVDNRGVNWGLGKEKGVFRVREQGKEKGTVL